MAGCGCGGPRMRVLMPAMARSTPGMYMLANYDTCTQTYRGDHAGDAVHVVATGTPNERLFLWEQDTEAVAYATSLGLNQIDNVPVSSLCQRAVEDLYAAAA